MLNCCIKDESATTCMNNLKTSRFRKLALIILILLLITAFFILLVLYTSQPSKPTVVRVCTSKQCLRSAGNLAVSMDMTVKPCEDFYKYVCGNWANAHPQLDSDTDTNWSYEKTVQVYAQVRDTLALNSTGQPKPVEQARDFYASCMDTETIEELGLKNVFEVLKSVNLPLFPTILNVSGDADLFNYNFDWLDTVIKIKTQLDMHIFMGFDIAPINSSENILLGLTGTTEFPRSYSHLPKFSNNYRQSNFKFLLEQYINHVKKNLNDKNQQMLTSDEYDLLKKYIKESGISVEIDDTILHQNIIESLKHYNSLNDDIEMQQRKQNYPVEWNVDDLQSNTDFKMLIRYNKTQPIWKRYLEGIFNVSNVDLDFEKDKVMVDETLLSGAVGIAASKPPNVVELYIWMKVVKALEIHITAEKNLRSLLCSLVVNELLGMAVSYAIVEPDIFNVTKPKVLNMISDIKHSLHESVAKADWMDDKIKNASYEKITKMNSLVGIPEWFYEPGKLEQYYEGVETSRDMYLKNMVNIVQSRLRKHLNKFRDPNYFLWTFEPSKVNAAYSFDKNSITIPMVMLQYPFFDLGLDSLNYGNLGYVLGHEITHGFDNKGLQYDMNGNFVPLGLFSGSYDTLISYSNLVQCFVDQYSSYCVAEINKYINGEQTLGENIADNGGLNQALTALKRHLQEYGPEEKLPGFEPMSSEQMFFLSFAHLYCSVPTEKYLSNAVLYDPHTPAVFRVRGTLHNSEEFARAWNCPLGSPMNPIRTRCIIF